MKATLVETGTKTTKIIESLNGREELYSSLFEVVGNTPLYEIKHIPVPNNNRIFAKEEWLNPTGSTFDRLYPHLFRMFEKKGRIIPGVTPVVEVSTGNAGAAFARCASKLGYDNCTVIIHEDAPKSRVKQIKSYGAKIIYSPRGQYAKGYVDKLERILIEDKNKKGGKYESNPEIMFCVTKIHPKAHTIYKKLVDEVYSQLNGESIDYFVTVVGSGTSSTGIARYIKERDVDCKVIVADPKECPSTYHFKYDNKQLDFKSLPHNVFGSASFGLSLKKLNIDLSVIDEVKIISKADREKALQILTTIENKPVGRPSSLVMANALKLARKVSNKSILINFSDPLWKYENHYPYLK